MHHFCNNLVALQHPLLHLCCVLKNVTSKKLGIKRHTVRRGKSAPDQCFRSFWFEKNQPYLRRPALISYSLITPLKVL